MGGDVPSLPAGSLTIESAWDGTAARADETVHVVIQPVGDALLVRVDAPLHGDSPPPSPPGATPRLWEHEVVEVMLLGEDERYLEVELGPAGHHLVLELHGVRNIVREGLPLEYEVKGHGTRWRGEALVPIRLLPPGCERLNAFAIHGVGEQRRYLAWSPAGGDAPDFHRLDAFRPFDALR